MKYNAYSMGQRKRQLAAIVFTDIVGYASLMQEDERRALELRQRHRAVFDTLTPKYGGRILQYYGDGTLSIFNSAVAAVECAVEMQREFSQDPRVPLRIGIHTGDISYDDTDVFGDGVNVASRVEPCCIPGGVYITGKVYDDIKNHEWLQSRFLGDFSFKGIDESIRLFAIENEGVAVPVEEDIHRLQYSEAKLVSITTPASTSGGGLSERIRQVALVSIPILLLGLLLLNIFDRNHFPSFPKPETSIAVLPFDNLSREPDSEYFSDGVTEEILALLSHIEGLRVVSSNSIMQYKNTKKPHREIGRELNADHILEGSVRRNGDQVRISAQLIDVRNDDQVWAAAYDEEIGEIFHLQSEVAHDIAKALRRRLSENERAALSKKPTQSVRAYEYYLKGREFYSKYTPTDNDRAIRLFKSALRADPSFAQAYAGLGDALAQKAFMQNMDEPLLDSAIAMSIEAIQLDRELSDGYKALGLAYHYRGWFEKALEEYRKAVERNPNNSMAINNIGAIYQEQGKLAEAVRWAQQALRISPQYNWSIMNLAKLYYIIGEDDKSLTLLQRGMKQHPDFRAFRELAAATYLRQDDFASAKQLALDVLATDSGDPLGYQLMGSISLMEGKWEEAKAFFQEVKFLSEKLDVEYDPLINELNLAFVEIKTGNGVIGRTRMNALLVKLREKAVKTEKPSYDIALSMGHSILGEKEEALAWLERAVTHHWYDYQSAEKHPFFENLHQHPQFRQIMQRLRRQVERYSKEVESIAEETLMS